MSLVGSFPFLYIFTEVYMPQSFQISKRENQVQRQTQTVIPEQELFLPCWKQIFSSGDFSLRAGVSLEDLEKTLAKQH